MSDRALEAIALFAKLATAVGEAQAVLANYVHPGRDLSAEDALNQLLSILDDKQLVVAQRSGAPEPIRVQAATLLKHSPPPAGADIEVSAAFFKMAQNIARWCASGAMQGTGEHADDALNYLDAGPAERGERSDRC